MTDKRHEVSVWSLAAAALVTLFSYPMIVFTWHSLRIFLGRQALSTDTFYIAHWWDAWMLACFLAGPVVLILITISTCTLLRTGWPRWLLMALPWAFVIEMCTLVVIPNLPSWHLEIVQNTTYMGSMERRLEIWGREHGRFPLTREEWNTAVDPPAVASPYRQGGNTLNYQIEFVPNQSAPFQTTPKQPGIVYYAVDPDGHQFWLTVSGLNAPYADRARMAHTDPLTSSKQPWGELLVVTDVYVGIRDRKP